MGAEQLEFDVSSSCSGTSLGRRVQGTRGNVRARMKLGIGTRAARAPGSAVQAPAPQVGLGCAAEAGTGREVGWLAGVAVALVVETA